MATIQFDNGQKVEFDGTPTPADIEEVAKKLGIGAPVAAPGKTMVQKVQGIPEAATAPIRGIAKGIVSTLGGAGAIVEKGAQAFSRAIGAPVLSEVVGAGNKTVGESIKEKVRPVGAGEKIGFAGEQIAEFFTPGPGGKVTKLAEGASMLTRAARAFKTGAIQAIEAGTKTAAQTGGDLGQSAGVAGISLAVPLAGLAFKTPLTLAAEKLYSSAAKFTGAATDRAASKGIDLVKTALKERVFLTEGGVERVAAKIDDMENMLGRAIETAKRRGTKISLAGMQSYIDEAKELFKYDVDVASGKAAIRELDNLVRRFVREYTPKKAEVGSIITSAAKDAAAGRISETAAAKAIREAKYIPLEVAQKIKVATGQQLAKYYQRLSSVGIEGRKQATRFLKDKIVEAAPIIGDINKRLSSLYELDKALDASTRRIKNLNLLGIGTKILLAGGTKETTAAAGALQLLGSAFSKSGAAIGMNELAKILEASATKGQIPLAALMDALLDAIRQPGSKE